MEDCSICCEQYNKSSRKAIECNFCAKRACAACIRTYLLSVDDPHCMHCKRPWTDDMVDTSLTNVFLTGPLKKHREDVLLLRERSLLPDTQLTVENIYRQNTMRTEIARIERELYDARVRLSRSLRGGVDHSATSAERRQFIKPCPAEGCRGFLSTQYNCGLCSTKVCPDCHEIKTDGAHECNDDLVASVAAIKKDSKPCPKCGAMIHRIYGCDQMFCTAPNCNTPFSWNTGNIITHDRMHNPHYYAYMQTIRGGTIGRELDDIPCGGMPTGRQLVSAILDPFGLSSPSTTVKDKLLKDGVLRNYTTIITMHRFAVHLQDAELNRYPAVPDVIDPVVNQDLRIRFLMKEIDDKRFKEILQQREKHRKKSHAIHQILSTIANVSSDLFRNIIVQKGDPAFISTAMEQMCALRNYSNDSLATVSKKYACVVPELTLQWSVPLTTIRW